MNAARRILRCGLASAAGILLAFPISAIPPNAAAPVPAHAAAAPIPCPAPAVKRSPKPTPPPTDPRDREVGGAALATPGLVTPPGAAAPPAITATSWVVADLDTGQVLGGCGPHEHAVPASTQKLLLAATVLPKLDPKQVITVTRKDLDFEPGSSAVGLLEGGKYPVETLWLGLLLNSGNDAANVLARLGGGDAGVAGTIAAMNEKARELGARQTRAVTPSGLDGPGQYTSAYDLALIARACFAEEAFRRYTLTRQTKIPAQPPRDKSGFQIQNENQLVFRYRGALGGKTGFTTLARHSYVGAAERDGRRLVVTLLGAEARPLRGWQQGAALLDWGFGLPTDASVGNLVDPGAGTATPTPADPEPGGQAAAQVGEPTDDSWVRRPVMLALAAALGVIALVLAALAARRGPRHIGRRRAR
ncbi:D-alanyl-D-alanine carboxypeptidase family protein [Plantactinospora sp. GCM10030261]|uniref:D-alanyl-D-alanine carboxypeptidase family protein n=1 Tax=Plantactinospora sp. GCM10030261 TaxID=3273420 RepID=UPI003610950B